MRTGITFTVTPEDEVRLEAIVRDRSSPQKHVWRTWIVLLSAGGFGTHAIMAATGKSETCVWRWQERFAEESVDGLLRDKTRLPGTAPVPPAKLTRRRLKRGVFRSLLELQTAINRFTPKQNDREAKPFVWTADPDRIIAARNRGFQTLDSNH